MPKLRSAIPSTSFPLAVSDFNTKVILVRHARTTYNQQGRYQGSSDESVLTNRGHLDAYATGIALQKYDFDAIYTSPLARVQQTTREIITALKSPDLPVYIDSSLTEVCMSDWQGLSYQEVKQRYPEAYRCWQSTPHLFTRDRISYPVLELFERVQSFWQETLRKHRGQTILIVAHGGTNRALIGTAIALSPQYYHSLQQCNCGISCLKFSPSSNLGRLKYLNDTSHLGKTLPKLKAGKTGWRWLLMSNNFVLDKSNNSYLKQLAEQDLINLVLTDNSKKSQALATCLADSGFHALQISIERDDFLANWQKTIAKKQQTANNLPGSSELFTGLIIVSEKLRSRILRQGTNVSTSPDLSNYLAVVHYPHTEYRAILQGILPLNSDRYLSMSKAI